MEALAENAETKPMTVLAVDDDAEMCEMIVTALKPRGITVTTATSAERALALLRDCDYDVVATDLNMKGMSGIELCRAIVANREDIPVVVITAFGSMEAAVEAIRAGAYDFVTKPFDFDAFVLALGRAAQHKALRQELKRLREVVKDRAEVGDILGKSPPMQKVYDLITRLRDTDATVLITGESGTGKELVARSLHQNGLRKDGPFVAVNCAAMPEPLLESELFGHVRGAFTDAKAARTGLFLKATGGTLFLDEIGEMPPGMQAKLLRALQERQVRPVGSDNEVSFDTRIVTATNRDLEGEVEENRFRQDLYYRINVVRIAVPPLRARGSDILLLAQHYLERFSQGSPRRIIGIAKGAADKLMQYRWPGNVRELQNCMERAVALARFDHIVEDDLPEKIRDFKASRVVVESDDPADLPSLDELERRYILRVLETVSGNKTLAAQTLGVDRRTLYRKLARIDP